MMRICPPPVLMGRGDAARWTLKPHLYHSNDGFHRFPILEVDNHKSVTPGVYGHDAKSLNFGEEGIPDFLCPAPLDADTTALLSELAIRAHKAIGALDVSRVDMRMDAQGQPLLLEINTLPGLSPGFSDLCVLAGKEGLTYTDLILEILYLGASRAGLLAQLQPAQTVRAAVRSQRRLAPAAPLNFK